MGGCRGMVVGTTNAMAAQGQNLVQQDRQACVRHGCEREIEGDRGNLRAPLRRCFCEASGAFSPGLALRGEPFSRYLPTAKRSGCDWRSALLSFLETYVWYGLLRELYLLVPFGPWRHPLPCLSLAHTNICIHIGRSVPLCNMLAGYLLGTFQY